MKTWGKYIKPYWLYFVLGPLCMVIEVIGELLMPKYLAMIINNATSNTPAYSMTITLFLVLTALLMLAGGFGGAYFGAKACVNFATDLRFDIYKKIQSFSFSNIDKFTTGSLVTRLTNDVDQMRSFINVLLRIFLRAPGMMIGSLVMAIILRPALSLVFTVAIPIMLLFVGIIIFFGLSRFTIMQSKIDKLNNTVQENITNARVVKSFVRRDYEISKFQTVNTELKDAGLRAIETMILLLPVVTLVLNFTTVAVLWFGGRMVVLESNPMPVGDLSAFIMYCNQILMSLMMMTMVLVMSSRAMASAKRIKEVLNEEVNINDINSTAKDKHIEHGCIEFKNVSFSYYKDSQSKVLNNINMKIDSGSTIGIIGSTGSGKTTLVSLIPRLYDPDDGNILIDGIDVKEYSLENLREGVGMVLQQNVLFSGTIKENLKWGNENASDEEVKQFAEIAQADKFITNFTDGYDTNLDKGGLNVSGGQKQRLCIARALLKKPKILILDDSTSAVDTATETQIRMALKNELSDSTKIVIAQRISSVIHADKIFVIDEGRIVGNGNHQQLLETCTAYQEIYYSQIEKNEEEN